MNQNNTARLYYVKTKKDIEYSVKSYEKIMGFPPSVLWRRDGEFEDIEFDGEVIVRIKGLSPNHIVLASERKDYENYGR